MFTELLLALALGTATPHSQDEIAVIEDHPTVVIPLEPYDLGRSEDLRKIERKIRSAAISVCDNAYRGVAYLETVACVKAASADGDAQLVRLIAHHPTASLTAAIELSAPAN